MCVGPHAFIPADNTCRVEMIYDTPGGVAENVLHFGNEAGWNLGALEALANALDTWHEAWLDDVQSEGVALRLIHAVDVATESSYEVNVPIIPARAGAVATPVLPSNCTLAVKFTSGLSGRSRRGRAYHVGLGENMVTGDSIDSTVLADILTAYGQLILGSDSIPADTWLTVVSYCGDGDWRTDALLSLVTDVSSDGTVDSQRRRLSGRGI